MRFHLNAPSGRNLCPSRAGIFNKVFLISIIFAVLSISSVGQSATVGNIAGLQGGSGRYSLGIEYDSVAEREMDFDGGDVSREDSFVTTFGPFPESGAGIVGLEMKSNRVLLRGTAGLTPWLDLFLKLGIADADWSYTIKSPTLAVENIKYDGSMGVAYGAGFKGRITHWGSWQILSEFQFLRYELEGDYTINGQDFATVFLPNLNAIRSRSKARVQEFQLAIYIAGTIGMMTPYVGLKVSDLTMKIDSKVSGRDKITAFPATESRHEAHQSADPAGLFIGTGLEMNGPWTANIEIRFVDETAVSLGINRHF